MDFTSLLGGGGGGGGSKEFGSSTATTTLNFGDEGQQGTNWMALAAIAGAVLLGIVVVIATLKRKG